MTPNSTLKGLADMGSNNPHRDSPQPPGAGAGGQAHCLAPDWPLTPLWASPLQEELAGL